MEDPVIASKTGRNTYGRRKFQERKGSGNGSPLPILPSGISTSVLKETVRTESNNQKYLQEV